MRPTRRFDSKLIAFRFSFQLRLTRVDEALDELHQHIDRAAIGTLSEHRPNRKFCSLV
jgi:hypothetical protein